MMLISQRHVAGPAHFDDREAASFGPTLRHLERTLEELTGALRIYTAAMGESHPHFHCHMVPRYAETPRARRPGACSICSARPRRRGHGRRRRGGADQRTLPAALPPPAAP